MKIKGRKSMDIWDVTEDRNYSLEEIRDLLYGGKHSAFLVVMNYSVNGIPCKGAGLTLWDETHAPFHRDNKLVVTTYFCRRELGLLGWKHDSDKPILVEVIIEPSDPLLSISFRKIHLTPRS